VITDDIAADVLREFTRLAPEDEIWPPEAHRQARISAMRAALETVLPIPYRITEAGRAMLKGGE